jgi:hypothetical protein
MLLQELIILLLFYLLFGTYEILFQLSITESAQLVVTLNNVELPYTLVGRASGTSQLIGMAIVETTAPNSLITVRNPVGNFTSLTLTPIAGGTRVVSASLIIKQIA